MIKVFDDDVIVCVLGNVILMVNGGGIGVLILDVDLDDVDWIMEFGIGWNDDVMCVGKCEMCFYLMVKCIKILL